jgi:hypothetical protein
MGEERKVYKVLVGKPEGKRPLGRPRRRWEDGIRMDLREIGLGSVEWIQLAHDRGQLWALVSAVMNLRVLAPRSYLVKSPSVSARNVSVGNHVLDNPRYIQASSSNLYVFSEVIF